MTPEQRQFLLEMAQRHASAVKWVLAYDLLMHGDKRTFLRVCVILLLFVAMQVPLDLWLK
jgi:hypothetical protein